MTKDPSFPFYASDWLGSSVIPLMSADQERGYLRLLCHLWGSGCALPDDDDVLSRLSLMGEGWFKGGSTLIRHCFTPHPQKPGFITNAKLMAVWDEREEWREKSRRGGKKSAQLRKARAESKGGSTTVPTNGTTNGQPLGNSSSSSSSSSPIPFSIQEDNTNPPPPLNPKPESEPAPAALPLDPPEGGRVAAKKKRKDRPPLFAKDVDRPPGFDSPEVTKALDEWLAYKARRSESYRDAAGAATLLRSFSNTNGGPQAARIFQAAVDFSIGNNYIGLVAPRINGKPQSQLGPGQIYDPSADLTWR